MNLKRFTRQLLPWLITAAALGYVFGFAIDWEAIPAATEKANLPLFIAITVKQFGGAGSFPIVILEGRQKTARLRENIKSMEHVRTGRMLERYMGKP